MKKTIVDKSQIEKLAGLSALEFDEAGKDLMVNQVSGIIDMLDACANVKGVDTVTQSVFLNDLREDVAQDSMNRDEALISAPRTEKGYIVVPKVVE